MITKDEVNQIAHALSVAEAEITRLTFALAMEESSHTQTIAKDDARIATLETALRALATKEPRIGRTANTLDACIYCGTHEDKAAWEAWHEKHGWGYLERDAEHRECPDMPIAHADVCPWRLACELLRPSDVFPMPHPDGLVRCGRCDHLRQQHFRVEEFGATTDGCSLCGECSGFVAP